MWKEMKDGKCRGSGGMSVWKRRESWENSEWIKDGGGLCGKGRRLAN